MQVSLSTLISNAMKRFIIKIALFFALLVVADVLCGFTLGYFAKNAKGGFTYRDNFICDELETDILISGSSRCVRHYNPQIISDSVGMSCYNSGQMGNGIILNYGRMCMLNEHRKPSVVIYDLHPSFDLLEGEDNHRYLTWLKGHYDRNGINEIFSSIDKTEEVKMKSQLYRYNSQFIEILSDFFYPSKISANGYTPLKGSLDRTKVRTKVKKENFVFDTLKVAYLRKMMDIYSNSKLVIVVSPSWYGMDSLQFAPVQNLCSERNIPFYDFSNNSKYVHNDEYFNDGLHMNNKGADEFTKDLTCIIRKLVQQ